jgi:hypothetical protein
LGGCRATFALAEVDRNPKPRRGGEAGDDRDRSAVAERVRGDAGEQSAGDVAHVAPEAVDANGRRASDGRDRVRDGGDQRGVDECGSHAQHNCRRCRDPDGPVGHGQQREGSGLGQHAGDDQRFSSDAVRPLSGQDLADPPDTRVQPGDEAHLRRRGAIGGQEERDDPPGQGVVEVVDQAGLRARSQLRPAIRRVGEHLGESRRSLVAVVVALLLQTHVARGIADEGDGDPQGDQGDSRRAGDEDVPRREVRCKPSADRCRDRDSAVASGLVEAEGKPAALWADEVDLHDDGHRPGEALVDAEQGVGGDDPGPAGGDGDQQRHRQGDRPTEDQQPSSPEPLGSDACGEVGERLGEAEGDDERKDSRARCEPEVGLADERQGGALEPDHRADEGVDGYEQGELREVLAEPESDCGGDGQGARSWRASGRRRTARPRSCPWLSRTRRCA